jgi:hypothetical protein
MRALLRQLHTMAAIDAAREQSSTATHSRRDGAAGGIFSSVKVSQLAELLEAFVDLLPGELGDAFGAKAFNSEGAHDAAVEHGVPVG